MKTDLIASFMKFIYRITLLVCCSIFFISCKKSKEKSTSKTVNSYQGIGKGDEIINQTIKAHGGKNYENNLYSFEFRGKEYSFINTDSSYIYSVKHTYNTTQTVDVLNNGTFSRTINNKIVDVSKKKSFGYTSALNSVIYFALLPYKLNDAAVNKDYHGIVNIKGKKYHAIQVTFDQEGGGEDHDDVFCFWINTLNNRVDYLAYKYHVNGGGIRFREAFNTRNVNNVIFQDYINYKADPKLNLEDLPDLFNKDQLIEVSRIELKNVQLVN